MNATDLIDPVSAITGNKPELKETKHWYLPLDNCLLNRMKPSGSHSSAFSWLRLLPQNRDKLLSVGSI